MAKTNIMEFDGGGRGVWATEIFRQCLPDAHEWRAPAHLVGRERPSSPPGVYTSAGGGVSIYSFCRRCGAQLAEFSEPGRGEIRREIRRLDAQVPALRRKIMAWILDGLRW